MSACKGTYALLLACHSAASLQVGRWGLLHTLPGNYIYVGSAFGPGGLESRLSRHFRSDKPDSGAATAAAAHTSSTPRII